MFDTVLSRCTVGADNILVYLLVLGVMVVNVDLTGIVCVFCVVWFLRALDLYFYLYSGGICL